MKSFIIGVILVVLFSSCSDEDSDSGRVTITINNNPTKSSSAGKAPNARIDSDGWFYLTVEFDGTSNEPEHLVLRIEAVKEGSFTVAGRQSQSGFIPPTMAFYTYDENDDAEYYYSYLMGEDEAGKINVTKLDRSSKTISGTFDLRLGGTYHHPDVVQTVSGKFTNIKFKYL